MMKTFFAILAVGSASLTASAATIVLQPGDTLLGARVSSEDTIRCSQSAKPAHSPCYDSRPIFAAYTRANKNGLIVKKFGRCTACYHGGDYWVMVGSTVYGTLMNDEEAAMTAFHDDIDKGVCN